MSDAAVATIMQMVESLPDAWQEKAVEQLRELIADLEEEEKWDASFARTQDGLAAAARKARQEIAEGKAEPMDFGRLFLA